MYPSRRRRHVG